MIVLHDVNYTRGPIGPLAPGNPIKPGSPFSPCCGRKTLGVREMSTGHILKCDPTPKEEITLYVSTVYAISIESSPERKGAFSCCIIVFMGQIAHNNHDNLSQHILAFCLILNHWHYEVWLTHFGPTWSWPSSWSLLSRKSRRTCPTLSGKSIKM